MQFRELKQDVLREIRLNNWKNLEDVSPKIQEQVPRRFLKRWLDNISQLKEIPEIPRFPHLVNRFTLGSDPEFSLVQQDGIVYDAMNFGMQAGLAFGMDNNSRL